jgi:monothiol glutaredoxin
MTNQEILNKIDHTVKNNDVVLYMKGTAKFPQCGFSAVVVKILNNHNVKFLDINILADAEIRQGIKDYANWPTIPQLYVKGEFIGGCDIVREMEEEGELLKLLIEKNLL